MRPGGGKQKGSSFERLICKQLSLWLTDNERDDVLWRSAMSGGRATVRLARGDSSPHISGDICAVHEEGFSFINDFFPECKDYKSIGVEALVLEQSGLLAGFWATALDAAEKHEKLPMLIFHTFHRPICVALTSAGVQYLGAEEHLVATLPPLDMHILHFEKLTSLAYPRLRG